MSAARPAATMPNRAAPRTPASTDASTSTGRSSASALSRFHSRLRAPPPQTRTRGTSTSPASRTHTTSMRTARATPSSTASARCAGRVWLVRPRNTPRASGCQYGAHSPSRCGRKTMERRSRRPDEARCNASRHADREQRGDPLERGAAGLGRAGVHVHATNRGEGDDARGRRRGCGGDSDDFRRAGDVHGTTRTHQARQPKMLPPGVHGADSHRTRLTADPTGLAATVDAERTRRTHAGAAAAPSAPSTSASTSKGDRHRQSSTNPTALRGSTRQLPPVSESQAVVLGQEQPTSTAPRMLGIGPRQPGQARQRERRIDLNGPPQSVGARDAASSSAASVVPARPAR